jgi:sarcosine oxidase, subunit beta
LALPENGRATADVVIVGGGCMGASVAYHLAKLGITDVVLLEREETLGTGATGRNAGGVRLQFSHEANVRLSLESIALLERFEEEVGTPLDLFQDGYLFLLSSPRNVGKFRENVEMQRRLGVDVHWLTPEEAALHAPGIDPEGVLAATFCARDGIADPSGVTLGFAGAARRAGVRIREGVAVTDVRTRGGRIVGVDTSAGRIDAPLVVNAAGPWARRIGEMAGVRIPIEPLRRHIFVAEPPSPAGWVRDGVRTAPESRIMVIDFETTFYFHREGTGLLFGMGDPDEPFGYDSEVDWDVLEKVAPVAARRLPALEDAPIAHAWAGLYEMTPDAMPILGPAGGIEGFHLIGGFSGHGFQHAPAAGRIVADLVAGRDPGMDLSPFAFERLGSGELAGEANVV